MNRNACRRFCTAVDFDSFDHRGFARIRLRHEERLLPAPPRFDRDRQTPLTERTAPLSASSPTKLNRSRDPVLDFLGGDDHAERNRQIEAGSFLFYVGGREIDRRAPVRPVVTAVADRRRDAILAFFDRRVGQTDDDDLRIAAAGVDLDLHFVGVDPVDRSRVDPGEHGARVSEENAEVHRHAKIFRAPAFPVAGVVDPGRYARPGDLAVKARGRAV